jgi:type II secretory pathway pseudopilin PulG
VQNRNSIRRQPRPSEEGYLLLAVMFLLFLLALSVTVAAPRMARAIQHDRDVETMERGKQYIRAVQLYYRKFHAYPPSADALVKTNDIRFLRKKYIDPITGKDDWKPIMFGQNKVPIAMGFFGQPLAAGSSVGGIGPSGNNGINGVNGTAAGGAFNSSGGSGSIFDSSGSGSTTGATTGGSADNSNGGSASGTPTSGSSDSSGSSASGTTGTSATGTGQTGQTFGGAGVIGFEPASSKQSMLIWKKKDHYNEWEFTYDPIMDMRTMSGGNTGAIGQPASGMSSPVGAGTTTGGPFGSTPGTTSSPPPDSSTPQ